MNDFIKDPIPLQDSWNWNLARRPLIKESKEPLINAGLYPKKILIDPQYFIQRISGSLPAVYIRQGVFKRLLKACSFLPPGYKLVLFDVWRSNRCQQALFNILKNRLKKFHPNFSDKKLERQTRITVAPPAKDIKNAPSPHNTGGAVDLAILDNTGQLLDFGTPFDDSTEKAQTNYFEKKLQKHKISSSFEKKIVQNRRLLYNILIHVGFSNYADEWWHFDFGNQNWAWRTKHKNAIYGTIAPHFAWKNNFT